MEENKKKEDLFEEASEIRVRHQLELEKLNSSGSCRTGKWYSSPMYPECKLPPTDDYEAKLIDENKKLVDQYQKAEKEHWEFQVKHGLSWEEIKDDEGDIIRRGFNGPDNPRETWLHISQHIFPFSDRRERHPLFDYDNNLKDTEKELHRIHTLSEDCLVKAIEINKELGEYRKKKHIQPFAEKVEIKETSNYIFQFTGDHFRIKFGTEGKEFTRKNSQPLRVIYSLLSIHKDGPDDVSDLLDDEGYRSDLLVNGINDEIWNHELTSKIETDPGKSDQDKIIRSLSSEIDGGGNEGNQGFSVKNKKETKYSPTKEGEEDKKSNSFSINEINNDLPPMFVPLSKLVFPLLV